MNYGCTNTSNSAYGAGNYGTCTSQTVGAPDTGFFSQLVDSGSFTILAPLVAAIVLVSAASVIFNLRKKNQAKK